MSINSFNGGLGSGKTLRLSIWLKEQYDKGLKILSNYDLSFPHKKINPTDLINGLFDEELNNSAIGLTEAYTFLDSRFSGSESSRYISYFMLQTRKRKIKIGYDAQIISSVELRLRYVTNSIYECVKLVKDRNADKEDIDNIIGFYYNVYEDDGTSFVETLDIKDAIKYFKLYNTEDVLLPQYLQPTLNIDEVLETFSLSDNRDTFSTLLKTYNPYMTDSKCRAIYTLLKSDRLDKVKEILRINN